MKPVKIEELKDQTKQNISTAEESASEAPSVVFLSAKVIEKIADRLIFGR